MGADEIQTINRLYQLFLLGLIALRGPGPIAADALLRRQLDRWFPPLAGWSDAALTDVPHVVVIGAGFGGLTAAHGLRLAACRVTVIDKRNYHLFQPLLYQVATASLSPADIATPIRALFRDQHNVRVMLGEVVDVDIAARQVNLSDGARIGYDYLVLATGARHSYFGRDDWEPHAPGLKLVDDATAIRRRLLQAFEQAENCADPEERQRLLTFIIVGGGPTGVELAGAIAELARHGLAGEFRNIDPAQARVLLVQSAPRLLPSFPESLSEVSAQSLRTLGVEVMTKSRVETIDAEGALVSGQRIGSRTVFWAAGVMASPAAQWLKTEADAAGRLKVGADLTVPGLPEVFAVGDTALSEAWDGKPVPGLAPAAKQQGAYVARIIKARLEGRTQLPPFRYRHLGNLATIGRQAAVVDFGWIKLSGALAWWLWGLAHIYYLVDTRKRFSVAIEWFWAYLTYKRGTRLITGGQE
ncbi:MAG TPA: NAD(P)/FAD-dependent oxidoreductase [Azonexus sp.]|nr:NAD(P)/FAD-dependent oxidoreductase [Azonexus sp.]